MSINEKQDDDRLFVAAGWGMVIAVCSAVWFLFGVVVGMGLHQ